MFIDFTEGGKKGGREGEEREGERERDQLVGAHMP